ncbi:serine hydrolase domain-containing protein [Maribacter sp. 2210JD10-5]|uniref:serine hydrolase domain-containing protein n=1 Tax=Maribacter sp. 2210JD10-5 TaxID=3386272 RepID=UPI0039BD4B15
MKNSIRTIIFMCMIHTLCTAQTTAQKIDAIVKKYRTEHPKVGISVGFIHQNQEFYTAYGHLSRAGEVAINKNSVFELGSITKIITANLIAQAALERKFKLNDVIDSYLPNEFVLHPKLRNTIKISDLASHQSGLPDIDFGKLIADNPQQPTSVVTKETLTMLVNNATELTDYGTYRYSTLGYTLLGQILEEVYGKTYDELLHEKILTPLQLSDTFTKTFSVPHKTTAYNPEGGEQDFFIWNIVAPAGLIKSNASDMVVYLKAILNEGNAIYDASVLSEHMVYSKAGRELGLGLGILKDEGNVLYLKSGDTMGQSSVLCYDRTKNWGIIILLNERNSRLRQELLNEIYETVLR